MAGVSQPTPHSPGSVPVHYSEPTTDSGTDPIVFPLLFQSGCRLPVSFDAYLLVRSSNYKVSMV